MKLVSNERGDAPSHAVNLLMSLGTPCVHVRLGVRCGRISASSAGEPLTLEEWGTQCNRWWRTWSQQGRKGEPEHSDVPPSNSPTYEPPARPAFEVGRTDVPAELLTPVRAWFESGVRRDAAARAQVEPNLDCSPEENTAVVRSGFELEDFQWGYARQIHRWWIEGRRACVEVRGVLHFAPCEDEPARDEFSRWQLGLRERGGVWQVREWSYVDDDDAAER